MIRFAWTRFRTQALVAAGALAILAVILLVTGIRLDHAYDTAVAVCKQQGNCATNLGNAFPSNGYLTASNGMHPLVIAIPCVLGMFWGAPLAAREFETGTFRLAWTQGVTRTRWLAAKLAVAGAASMAVAGLLSLMVTWWSSPIAAAQMGTRLDPGIFSESGIAPVGYAAFTFAFGVTAGLLSRRTLPAMAVTLAIFVAVVWFAFPFWVRPHLLPPVQATSALNIASVVATGAGVQGARPGDLFVQTQVNMPGDWLLSSQIITPAGRPASSEPATRACTPATSTTKTCDAYLESLHLRQTVTYQPASRYWAFQWVETAIYLALALALAGFSFWWINRNRSTAPGIRRLRTRQPALTTDSLVLAEGAQFHRAAAGERVLGRDLDRLVEILAVEHVVADHELLGLGEGAVRDQRLPAAHPDGGGVAGLERAPLQAHAPAVHLRDPGVDVHAALRVSGVNGRVEADDHQVPHGCLLRSFRFFPLPHRRTGIGRIDTRVR